MGTFDKCITRYDGGLPKFVGVIPFLVKTVYFFSDDVNDINCRLGPRDEVMII